MTSNETPQTPTEIAKTLWDGAIEALDQARVEDNVATSDAYVRIGQLALAAASFALANPGLLQGIPEGDFYSMMPPGAPPLPDSVGGPQVWGAKG